MHAEQAPPGGATRVADWFRAQTDLERRVGASIRAALDEVLDGQRTGRYDVRVLGGVERQYIAIKLAYLIRSEFALRPGRRLDYLIEGREVALNWWLQLDDRPAPAEPVGEVLLCATADDLESTCSFGVSNVSDEPQNIAWIVQDGWLPENLLLHLESRDRDRILAHTGGQRRVNELFRALLECVVPREAVITVAQQADGPKRVRDARKALAAEGIIILGHQDTHAERARELGLRVPHKGEWMSVRVSNGPISPIY